MKVKGRGVFFLTAVWSLSGTVALAANQNVSVVDNGFIQPRVAVLSGESVTWTAPPSTVNPHNVVFEDGGLVRADPAPGPWTATRTFASAPAAFAYYCQIHGAPGGLGMSGVVYVNATGNAPPVAAFAPLPSVAQPGQTVTFNGSASSDLDGTITQYEWDLDGAPGYETSTTTPTTSRSYSTPGTVSTRLRVTDNSGNTEETTRAVRINAPPAPSFTVSPNPAQTGSTVTFDGAGSTDPDGTITRYEWDLDGNGSFERDTGATPTVARSYTTAATVLVGLRVTDFDSAVAATTRSLQVKAPLAITQPLITPPAVGGGPLPPSFAASTRRITVGKSGSFTVSFGAGAGLSGTMTLNSVSKVKVSARRRLKLGTKSFSVPASGVVKVTWKLSRKNLRILKRRKQIKFRAAVTLRNAAGGVGSGATILTLKRPRAG